MNRSIESAVDPKWNRDGLTKWDFGTLPDFVSITRGGVTVSAYPALCDPRFLTDDFSPKSEHAKTLALRLFDSKDKALRNAFLGVARMFTLDNMRDLRTQARYIPQIERMRVCSHTIPDFDVDMAVRLRRDRGCR